jgi:hypothetical protein
MDDAVFTKLRVRIGAIVEFHQPAKCAMRAGYLDTFPDATSAISS